jgi:hypothetical protein
MLISNEWAINVKRCSKCEETKPYAEFHKYKRGDGYRPWCKSCRKVYDHDYNLRNHRRWAEQKLAWQQSRGAWLREMKTGKTCTDCGGTFPPEAMEWDHLPGTIKLGAISNKIRTWSRKLIFEELAKCELVCANCHAIRTYRRLREAMTGV